jgi:hypothetical protein
VSLNIATKKPQCHLHDGCRFSFYKAVLHLFLQIDFSFRIFMRLLKITICFSSLVNSSQTYRSRDLASQPKPEPVTSVVSGRRKHCCRLSSWHCRFPELFAIAYGRIYFSIKC